MLYLVTKCGVHRRRLYWGSVKKTRYPRHKRGKSIILPGTFFCSYIFNTSFLHKMVKIDAVGNVYATENSPKCFCGRGSDPDPVGRVYPDS